MSKSIFMRYGLMLVLVAVMLMASTIPAYAQSDGTGIGYADEIGVYENATGENVDFEHGTYENGTNEEDVINGDADNNIAYGYGDVQQPTEPPTEDYPIVQVLSAQVEPPIQEPPLGSLVIINSTHDGQLLQGAVFALYQAGDINRITEMTTDIMGRTREIPLPQGNYNIVILFPAHGFVPITDVVGTTITAGQMQELTIFSFPLNPQEPDPEPTPEPTPPPVESGRLLLTLRAHGTGQLLGGAVYELRRVMDGAFVSYLVTDSFGEAAIDLPTGDYFLREVQAVSGFIPNPDRVNVRIAVNRLTEINLTSRAEPTPPTQEPVPPQPGRLIVTLRADGTREPIQGATFEVRRAIDNRLMYEITTDRFGEAAINLPPDDYFLRQLNTPQGFEFDTGRVNVRIATGAVREISVTNRRMAVTEPPGQTPPPQPEVANGRLLITVISSATSQRLEGVVYTVHDVMTDEVVATITTNAFGEASALLPPGQFFMRNAVMRQGYIRDAERVTFAVRSAAITNLTITARAVPQAPSEPAPTPDATPVQVTPTPETTPAQTTPPAQRPGASATTPSTPSTQGTSTRPGQSRVEIITRAEVSGHPMQGATFAVYSAIDSRRVGEVTTDMDGRAVISLSAGEYYLRNISVPFGFLSERSRIFFTASGANVTVEVTIQRDKTIPYADYGNISLPPTGELTPIVNYVLGTLFMAVSLLCGALLVHQHRQDQKQKYKRNRRNRNMKQILA
jgi:uncharacterized surface anchored protein